MPQQFDLLIDGRDPQREVIPRLTPDEIRQLVQRLPEPQAVYANQEARFEVYQAKKLFDHSWSNPVLYRLLVDARGSYYQYGDRPPIDEYDAKSAIYSARAVYQHAQCGEVEEWFSLRFVPCAGDPPGNGELDLFVCQGRIVGDMVRERIFDGNHNYVDYIAGHSRMCGIRPYFQEGLTKKEAQIRLSSGQKYSALCFALINKEFCDEYITTRNFKYVTGVAFNIFIKHALTIYIDGTPFAPCTRAAYQLFGLTNPKAIRLIRQTEIYRYPTYFLNTHQLIATLKKLMGNHQLSDTTMTYYLGTGWAMQDALKNGQINFKKLRNLGRLLTVDGPLLGARLTGEQLRSIINTEVNDGPELKIDHIPERIETISEMLRAACVERRN